MVNYIKSSMQYIYMSKYVSSKYIELKRIIKKYKIKKNQYISKQKGQLLKKYNSIYSKDVKVRFLQKKQINGVVITILLNGLFLNYIFYSFDMSVFSVGRVISFGLIYYYVSAEFVSLYRKLKYGE